MNKRADSDHRGQMPSLLPFRRVSLTATKREEPAPRGNAGSWLFALLAIFTFAISCTEPNTQSPAERYRQAKKTMRSLRDTASLNRAIDSLRAAGDKYAEAMAFNEIGRIMRNEGNFAAAIENHTHALTIAEPIHDSIFIAQVLNNIGTDYRRVGMLNVASDFHYRALNISTLMQDTSVENRKNRVVSLNGLGNIYLSTQNWTMAENVLRQALQGEQELGSYLGQAINHANLGSICEKTGRIDSALTHYRNSMELNVKEGSTLGIALCHTYFGSIHERRGDLDAAICEYDTAKSLLCDSRDLWHALTPAIAMAKACNSHNRQGEAMDLLSQAMEMANEINSIEHKSEILMLYYEIFNSRGECAKALEAFRTANALADSVVSIGTINDVQNVRQRYEQHRQDMEMERQTQTYEREKRSKEIGIVILSVLVLGAAGLSITLIQLLRIRNKQQATLSEMQRLKDTFFTNITHEFRTPLTVIGCAAQEIDQSNELDPNTTRRNAQAILRQSGSLLTLVNQILDIAKMSAASKSQDPNWRRGELNDPVSCIAQSFVDYAKKHGITLTIAAAEEDSDADYVPDYLEKILRNLISNAIKYNKSGGSIAVSLHPDANKRLHLVVSDTGIGMSQEEQQHVFEPFYQASSGNQIVGSGIGLSLVKMMTDALGWDIELRSEPEHGSTFDISIPTKALHPNALPAQPYGVTNRTTAEMGSTATHSAADSWGGEEPMHKKETTDEMSADESAPTILVVEDTADVAYYIGRQLHDKYRICYASNGKEGLEKADEIVPDLIITDVMMPAMDGYEMTSHIRANWMTSHIPIIMVTAKANHQDRIRGLELGVDAYLEKPFHADELAVRVTKLLEGRTLLQNYYQSLSTSSSAAHDVDPAHLHQPGADGNAQDSAGETLTGNSTELPTPPLADTGITDSEEITAAAKQTKARTKADEEFLKRIESLVDKYMEQGEVSIAAIASDLCITRHQMNRKVNAILGVNTSTLITQRRMAKAQELLAMTDTPIGDISMLCGFGGFAYFSAIFKKQTGMTPSQYRDKNRGF